MELIAKIKETYSAELFIRAYCGTLLGDINNYVVFQKLLNHMGEKNLPTSKLRKTFHHLCYEEKIINGIPIREWRDGRGVLHCVIKDNNGVCYPAQKFANGKMKWLRNGIPFSPGVDADGHSLPMEIDMQGNKFWLDHKDRFHRDEYDKYGNLLPAMIYPDGSRAYYIDGYLIHPKRKFMDIQSYSIECDREKGIYTIMFREACTLEKSDNKVILHFSHGGDAECQFDNVMKRIQFKYNSHMIMSIDNALTNIVAFDCESYISKDGLIRATFKSGHSINITL
jgi:hypothetical protein